MLSPWDTVSWTFSVRVQYGVAVNRIVSEFFRDDYGPLVRGIPLGTFFIRIADGVDINHPVEAAEGRAVFELHPLR